MPEPEKNKSDSRDPTSYRIPILVWHHDGRNDNTRASVARGESQLEEGVTRDPVPRHRQKPKLQAGRHNSDVRAFQHSNKENCCKKTRPTRSILGPAVKTVNRHSNPSNAFLGRHEPHSLILLQYAATHHETFAILNVVSQRWNQGRNVSRAKFHAPSLIGHRKQRTNKF